MAAFKGETEPEVAEEVDTVEWFRVGQLAKPIKFFQQEEVTECVMIGQITPGRLFDLRPDLRVIKILASLSERNAETMFRAVAEELGREGIKVLPSTTYLEEYLPGPGPVFGPKLDQDGLVDAAYGMRMAKEVSRLDIGQSVIVRDGTVLAVEAFEGTNKCVRRGGDLGKGKNVKLVKVSKPGQDLRFDVPVVGPDTIRACRDAGVSTVVIEARQTLVLGITEVKELCETHRVSLHAQEEVDQPG
ncbi:MAG: LpxI family protein [Roseibacillus sp. TMED18]|nr:MAG: LpxI family protein [Roseibacillus sp. TMED18]